MSRRASPIRTVLGVAVLAVAPAAAAGSASDSGVRGLVLYGPTCPVQRAGQTCERPLQTTVVVRHAAARTVVARVRSAADGRFTVRLGAGRYVLRAAAGSSSLYPRPVSQGVSVTAHHFTSVTLHVDSGIR
jgi:hypothetical protein